MAEQVFTNVQVLKGVSASEFMSTMGFFSASVGLNLRLLSCPRKPGGLEEVCRRRAAKTYCAKHDRNGRYDQQEQLRRTRGGYMLFLPSRQRSSQADPKSGAAVWYARRRSGTETEIPAQAVAGPSVDQILDKFVAAAGSGSEAIKPRFKRNVMKATKPTISRCHSSCSKSALAQMASTSSTRRTVICHGVQRHSGMDCFSNQSE